VSDTANRTAEREHLMRLCERLGRPAPAAAGNHFAVAFDGFTLIWERHTEFARYMLIAPGAGPDGDPFAAPAIGLAPADWVAAIPGRLLVATHLAVLKDDGAPLDHDAVAARYFAGNVLVGSPVAGGSATALTDFRIREDGFARIALWSRSMTPRQTGRTAQRLLELDSYRLMALLALPVARQLGPFLGATERELAEITGAMTDAPPSEEPALLARLTRLEAAIQSRHADNHFRFSAAAAYYDLVERRIAELREDRFEGVQTFKEFTERRLVPAVSTVRSAARQLDGLSERVGHATQSLATRTAITRERQNQALLETMARRAKMQLRLQQTVEGLSVAAISYYVVGLVGYVAKGLKGAGVKLDPDVVMALSIPLVVGGLAYGLNRIRSRLKLGGGEH
jgi:uncharacterized membrane-anchored protein